ncbi:MULTISPECIES: methyltransferase, FxLD system [unclassified Streptomyces]|uniref:methyltransferase, FxLD system n=1 Tax=unclassified Streptomyces TaxID=2593676 RepID=UPI001BE9AE94|nr:MULTISPECIES: methyltransferase, FxLD system [unclassified Streptomyces]MBT2402020.1 methyltransferase, FxLD system [Streptomyces sp. ISL-21]MBT2454267.1 methyltransferase, FxLD system [Streptomyces sp. ISL-86]MBT2609470.1 methyltransferase, FxLD system [Streptomyces sp. ISL-87]
MTHLETASPEALRTAMVDQLVRAGTIRSKPVEAAFRTVARHAFAPEAPLVQAYAAHDAVPTKKNEHGIAISSVSAPDVQAMMLEQAEAQAGMRLGEVGSGGYNAALMAEVAGPDGSVVTIDIDPDVTDRARRLLDAAGYEGVRVVLADAEHGFPDTGTLDLLIVTVGAWDIPPAWTDQLAEDGRLVVPLRTRGLTRSIAFDRDGDRLVSRSACSTERESRSSRSVTFFSAPIRCTVEISSSTSASVISRSRSCSSAASSVTRSGSGCVRRWDGDSTAVYGPPRCSTNRRDPVEPRRSDRRSWARRGAGSSGPRTRPVRIASGSGQGHGHGRRARTSAATVKGVEDA